MPGANPEITPRQAAVLGFIRDYVGRNLCSPTLREIGEAIQARSPNGVLCHIRALQKKGFVKINPFVARGIRLVGARTCPHCGKEL
jgi:repressor LexA